MPTPTEDELLTAIVAVVNSVSGIGRVHMMTRLPETDSEFAEVAVDDNRLINAVFIRPAAFDSETGGIPPGVISKTIAFEFIFMFGYVLEMEILSNQASEREFYRVLFGMRDAFNASIELGFDPGVNHSGFRTSSDIPPIYKQGDYGVHYAACRLNVTLADC